LKKQRRADLAAAHVLHQRERVADHLAGFLQPQLGAVREVRELERAGHDPRHVGHVLEHLHERPADVARVGFRPSTR
jgi:hypothetical protein